MAILLAKIIAACLLANAAALRHHGQTQHTDSARRPREHRRPKEVSPASRLARFASYMPSPMAIKVGEEDGAEFHIPSIKTRWATYMPGSMTVRSGEDSAEFHLPLPSINTPFDDDELPLDDFVNSAMSQIRGPGMMKMINEMRMGMCWKRPNLEHHEKCMRFLARMCKKDPSYSMCEEFTEDVTGLCEGFDQHGPGVTEKQIKMHKVQCEVAKEVNPDVMDPEDDEDGDGAPNHEDAFPRNANETKDSDNDGIGDNADTDADNDNVTNSEDVFPADPTEWKDSDGDGIGDNADVDDDNDGVPDLQDEFPFDPTRSSSSPVAAPAPGVAVAAPVEAPAPAPAPGPADADGDGVPDFKDAFPNDAKETVDSDGDGYGDNGDVFPDDPAVHQDTDGDGIGDNADAYPENPDCFQDPCVRKDGSLAPGAAPMSAEFKMPTEEELDELPWELTKLKRPLPVEGYNEHSDGTKVEHTDGKTFTSDWHAEWPQKQTENEEHTIKSICERYPDNDWCKDYYKHGNFAR